MIALARIIDMSSAVGSHSPFPLGQRDSPVPVSLPKAASAYDAGTVEGGGRVSFDIGRLALVAIAVALWVAVFRGFNAF
jgi:hypothetical protein